MAVAAGAGVAVMGKLLWIAVTVSVGLSAGSVALGSAVPVALGRAAALDVAVLGTVLITVAGGASVGLGAGSGGTIVGATVDVGLGAAGVAVGRAGAANVGLGAVRAVRVGAGVADGRSVGKGPAVVRWGVATAGFTLPVGL